MDEQPTQAVTPPPDGDPMAARFAREEAELQARFQVPETVKPAPQTSENAVEAMPAPEVPAPVPPAEPAPAAPPVSEPPTETPPVQAPPTEAAPTPPQAGGRLGAGFLHQAGRLPNRPRTHLVPRLAVRGA